MKNHLFAVLLALVSSQALAFPWYASGDNFRGAQLMTPEERQAHVARLQNMHSLEECQGYMQGHIQELDRRAKARGVNLPPVAGDPCAVMKGMGRIK